MPLIAIISFIYTITLVLFGANPAMSQENKADIHSPFPVLLAEKRSIPEHTCTSPDKPPSNLNYISVYTDKSDGISIVDPEAQKKYKDQIKIVTRYEKHIASWVEKIISRQVSEKDYCVIEWLEDWADQNAMLGIKASSQGEAVRKWFLATIASHYDILNQNVNLKQSTQQKIEDWIELLATQVVEDYSRNPKNNSRQNNHIYWSAWAVMMASTILDNQQLYDWALERAEKGVLEIQYNGILPRELSRQRRAFSYHVFAAAPLIMIAETVEQNGGDLYNQNVGGLHRLVSFIVSELNNKQATITALTGRKQKTKTTITNYSLAWLEVYNARFPSSKIEKWVKKLSPMKYRRVGGNTSLLFAQETTDQDKPAK